MEYVKSYSITSGEPSTRKEFEDRVNLELEKGAKIKEIYTREFGAYSVLCIIHFERNVHG